MEWCGKFHPHLLKDRKGFIGFPFLAIDIAAQDISVHIQVARIPNVIFRFIQFIFPDAGAIPAFFPHLFHAGLPAAVIAAKRPAFRAVRFFGKAGILIEIDAAVCLLKLQGLPG
jgi:hypothetical protein